MNGQRNYLDSAKQYFPQGIYEELLKLEQSKNLKKVVDKISNFVRNEGDGITTSQLRNIFAKVRREKVETVQLLRPKLAYTAARQKSDKAKVMIALFDDLITKIDDPDKLKSFKTFFESVIGYHKYHHQKRA